MFVFFKQKTAYELRISDWSSDVCSSDLFTIKLLTAKPCAAIARRDMLEERGRQIVAVVASLAPRHRNGSIDKHRLDQRDRPWRRRHQRPWRAAQPQAQLKIVPGFRSVRPFRQFVAPGDMMLRAAQLARLFRQIGRAHV